LTGTSGNRGTARRPGGGTSAGRLPAGGIGAGRAPGADPTAPGRTLVVVPLPGLPEVRPGDDLARLLLDGLEAAGERLRDGDVLAVTSKVVAKAEGRTVALPADPAQRERVRAETVAAETVRVVARRGSLVIAETRHGLVGANALVDASNTGGDVLVLLPRDPDASAARLRAALAAATGADVAVVVTDTLGRPWRSGHADVAVGLAGMGAIEDYRGRPDGDGRPLEVTEVAVADEVAAAADLVKGKVSRTPAALLRGVPRPVGDGRARDLVRPAGADLFRTAAGPEDLLAFLEGVRARRLLPDPVDPAAIQRAVLGATAAPLPGRPARPLRMVHVASPSARERYLAALAGSDRPVAGARPAVGESYKALAAAPVLLVPCLGAAAAPGGPGADHEVRAPGPRAAAEVRARELLAAGGAVHALLLALHAQGLAGAWTTSGPGVQQAAAYALDLPVGWLALGTVMAGHPDPADVPDRVPAADPAELLLRR
jgi:coenzyme F420-0:L-glutamate ligase/coenzyme F420-1:gamma-L-glutamate ligase